MSTAAATISLANLCWVGVGGMLGAIARYSLATRIQQWAITHTAAAHTAASGTAATPEHTGAVLSPWPWGTLAVNLLGCLLIGLLAGLAQRNGWGHPACRLFMLTGVLGGFTTFSAFGLETTALLIQRQWLPALAYTSASLLLGLAAVAAGLLATTGPTSAGAPH